MPMLCFLPWATVSEPVQFGAFHVIPTGVALDNGAIPEGHVSAVETILESYGHRRPVDWRSVPLLRRDDVDITSDLSHDEIADYFAFRTRLTLSVLSARQFFSLRYSNSDHARLVIQAFTPDRPGAAVLEHRRRDGSTRILVSAGNFSVTRPFHISDWCELPKDMDCDLLEALERAVQREELWSRLGEATRLFVGANTDSPDVSMHAELIDVISAFSRLANEWDEKGTVKGFADALQPPRNRSHNSYGPKLTDTRVKAGIANREAIRALWLKDVYILRSQFGHGRVEAPGYRPIWTEREHLLLAAVAFPLYTKAVLEQEGLYRMSERDMIMNRAFDDFALLEPFAQETEDESSPWSTALSKVQMQALAERIEHELEAAENAEDIEGDAI